MLQTRVFPYITYVGIENKPLEELVHQVTAHSLIGWGIQTLFVLSVFLQVWDYVSIFIQKDWYITGRCGMCLKYSM